VIGELGWKAPSSGGVVVDGVHVVVLGVAW
jgi:hypothetical protein